MLIIYDGWEHLKLINVVGVILGPVLAMFVAHVFSAVIARHVEVERMLRAAGSGVASSGSRPRSSCCVCPLWPSCRSCTPSVCSLSTGIRGNAVAGDGVARLLGIRGRATGRFRRWRIVASSPEESSSER